MVSETKKTVVAAMSGGVDSAVAALLLKQQGYDVIGITMQIWQEHAEQGKFGGCCSLGAVEDARRAAAHIGIPHYVLNFKDYFADKVIDHFVREYSSGRTPNPCVECNRSVKFVELMRQAKALGADLLATGHYARIKQNHHTGRYELRRAIGADKDQSYALYTLTQEQLAHTLMPLGELDGKRTTRELARAHGLALANKPDSQEICFAPREGYTAFLAARAPHAMRAGRVVDTSGRARGTHAGVALYTVGQRKRLPANNSGPLYVVNLDAINNTVVVGSNAELFAQSMRVANVNWVSVPQITEPLPVKARIRYNGVAADAVIEPENGGSELRCLFTQPQRAITPGQAAVFYGRRGTSDADGDTDPAATDCVLGGGTIETVYNLAGS